MGPTYEQALAVLELRLGPAALGHSVRVADTAAALAMIYGADADDARLAGLLHDWDRELDETELVAAARSRGVEQCTADEAVPYLLHARTGARAVAEALPGIGDEVLRAIERHTVGAADMSELDMILYVADMIEPGRTYKGVDDLREAVGSLSLESLFAEAYRHSVKHLVKERRFIHPSTVDVWNAHVARER